MKFISSLQTKIYQRFLLEGPCHCLCACSLLENQSAGTKGSGRSQRLSLATGSSEADQIYKICQVMGTPSKAVYADGHKLAANMNFRFPQFPAQSLAKMASTASPEAIDLMTSLCAWCA
jgi:hypothetical protein